jgi:hypothetical protein
MTTELHQVGSCPQMDIAHALASELDLDTGLLPPDALWYAKTAVGVHLARTSSVAGQPAGDLW